MPDVDLFLRTAGEQRTSNFLLWQSAYAELVFIDVLWPDFDRRDLWRACVELASATAPIRRRRPGRHRRTRKGSAEPGGGSPWTNSSYSPIRPTSAT